MPYYSYLTVAPTDDAWIPAYLETATRLVAQHGGRYLARTANSEQVEGDAAPEALRAIIEWPTREAALAFMNDPAYAPHLEARGAGSVSHHWLIDGTDDFA